MLILRKLAHLVCPRPGQEQALWEKSLLWLLGRLQLGGVEFQAKSKYPRTTKDLESKNTGSHGSYKVYRSPKFSLIFHGER